MSQLAAGAPSLRLGNLRPVRDLTYVRDTALGFIRMAESSAAIGQTINLGTGRGVSVQQLVQKIFSVAKTKATVESVRERSRHSSSEIFKLISDNRKARKVIHWKPEVSLEKGLEETWLYIERNLQRYKPELYNV
jgi:UDP-glucose 4-epimerase